MLQTFDQAYSVVLLGKRTYSIKGRGVQRRTGVRAGTGGREPQGLLGLSAMLPHELPWGAPESVSSLQKT